MGSSRGAMVRIVLDLKEGQHLYISVGQEGANACIKVSYVSILMPIFLICTYLCLI